MNYLVGSFPEAVRIDGVVYQVNADFRIGIKIMTAFEDPRLAGYEKQLVMCGLLFKKQPPNFDKACEAARKFLDCGNRTHAEQRTPGRVYSFTKDEQYIYSAILQTHGVDLQTTGYLHWWKFCAMFFDLQDGCRFQSMVSLRRRRLDGHLSKEERSIWYEMEDILSLSEADPDPERDAAISEFNRLMGGRNDER